MTILDREGFNIIDRQYKEELAEAQRDIRKKWEQEYRKKRYIGTPEMQAAARATMKDEMEQHIDKDVTACEQQISHVHFREFGGRQHVLQYLEQSEQPTQQLQQEAPQQQTAQESTVTQQTREEKEAAYEQRLQEHFNQQGQEKDKSDKGR